MRNASSIGLGLVLVAGGAVVLASQRLLSVPADDMSVQTLTLAAGAAAGYLMFGLGAFALLSGRQTQPRLETPLIPPTPAHTPPASAGDLDLAEALAKFDSWIEQLAPGAPLWPAFDQFVREVFSGYLRARRIRCYRVLADEERLLSLTGPARDDAPEPSAREGVLGHVVTTGRTFNRADDAQGELVRRLADEDAADWQLAWPLRVAGRTVGVAAVGEAPPDVLADRPRCEAAGRMLQTLWRHVACFDELRTARTTDKATGVLTREDFFAVAADALEESRQMHEPVAVLALTLEGLRGMDDAGRWTARDRLLERIGEALLRRVRRDDVVGRFSDERFVVILRRVDSALGRLIAQKTLGGVKTLIADGDEALARVQARIGLAGSGLTGRDLETLLTLAFGAADAARRAQEEIHADIPADLTEGAGA